MKNSENGKMDDMGMEEDLMSYPSSWISNIQMQQSIHLMNQSRQVQWARLPSNEQGR
jgi:hypothetical protein